MNQFRKTFNNEKGMFDIGSIIVGVIIVGVMAALVTATLIVAIPWFQNREATDALSIIQTAENTARTDYSEYVDYAQLLENNYITAERLSIPACVSLNATKDEYVAFVKSKSGKIYQFDSATGDTTQATTPTCSLS